MKITIFWKIKNGFPGKRKTEIVKIIFREVEKSDREIMKIKNKQVKETCIPLFWDTGLGRTTGLCPVSPVFIGFFFVSHIEIKRIPLHKKCGIHCIP